MKKPRYFTETKAGCISGHREKTSDLIAGEPAKIKKLPSHTLSICIGLLSVLCYRCSFVGHRYTLPENGFPNF